MADLQTLATLQGLFQEVFDNLDLMVTPETSKDDLEEWDSIAQVKLVLAVEAAFGIRIQPNEVETLNSVRDFADLVHRHAGRK